MTGDASTPRAGLLAAVSEPLENTSVATFPAGDWDVRRYRPRLATLYAQIERWRHRSTGDVRRRVVTGDNVASLNGYPRQARRPDPRTA